MKTKTYFLITIFFLCATLSELQMKAQPVCPTPEVNLGEDTHICPGSSLVLDAGLHQNTLWNDGSTDRHLLVSDPGVYFVWVENECGATNADTIIIELAENPEVAFMMPEGEYFCKGEQINVTANVTNTDGSVLYEWVNRDSNDPTLVVDTTGNYEVKAINEYGCETTREVFIEFQYPYEEEKILLASYDPETNKNFIVWSRTPEKRTLSYILINGNSRDNVFAEANFRNQNIFVDEKSEPLSRPSYYNIILKDSCDNTSNFRLENSHRTMHLSASTDADGNAILEWTPYLGFEYTHFYIYQGLEPDKLNLIDSIPFNPQLDRMSFIDRTAKEGVLYYYDIKVKTPEIIYLDNPDSKKAGSGPFVHSLSNLEDNMIRGTSISELEIMDQYLRVFPNPVKDRFRISYRNETGGNVEFILYDIAGRELASFNQENPAAGDFNMEFDPATYHLRKGAFFLKMNIENVGSLTRKVIKY